MCRQTSDIRDFKRFINSVISIPFSGGRYLNKRDLLVVEYIRLYNLSLYQQIYQKRKFFISHDKMVDTEIYSASINKKEFNVEAKDFFKELFSNEENFNYIDVLEEIFPYVKKYRSNQDLVQDGYYLSDGENSDIAKNRRMCSAKYFDLYFTNTENDFLAVGKVITSFVENINQTSDLDNQLIIFDALLKSLHKSYHKEVFERFQLYIEDLQEQTAFNMTLILFEKINEIDNSSEFFALNARKRVEIILWELLQKITDEHYNIFLVNISDKYGKINNISSILYWFENDKEGKNIDGRIEKLKARYQEMGDAIISNSINIYDNKYYSPKNIYGLYRLYKEDELKIKEYIKKVNNENTIFRLLYDIMSFSHGTTYKYSISKANLELFTTDEDIDQILKETVPISKDQQFVLDVFNSYRSGIRDYWGEAGIETSEEKFLIL